MLFLFLLLRSSKRASIQTTERESDGLYWHGCGAITGGAVSVIPHFCANLALLGTSEHETYDD